MPRVKRGKIALKRREKILKYTKGYKWGRKSKERAAKEALLHAWTHAFATAALKKERRALCGKSSLMPPYAQEWFKLQ